MTIFMNHLIEHNKPEKKHSLLGQPFKKWLTV